MTFLYDMGNAGDLLKHGVLAEVVRWQCEQGVALRFIDLFGGKPWEEPVCCKVARRVRGLGSACVLRAAQTSIEHGCYYGSGWVVRNVGKATECGTVRVLTTDRDQGHRELLRDSGLSLITEDFPNADLSDGYAAFENDVIPNAKDGDLVLIDPYSKFLRRRAPTIVPLMAKMAKRAAVLLFALNLDPGNRVGQRFDKLLKEHLPGAWRLTCPPLKHTGVKGESTFHADIVLAARWLPEGKGSGDTDALRKQLTAFAEQLAGVLELPAKQLSLRVVGQ